MENLFTYLYAVNVNGHTEEKNGLTYLSWAFAWAEIKKVVPDAQYTIYERETEFGPVNYFTDGNTCWVKTGVTLNGLEHIEMLPVMDFRNKSIPLAAVTSMDVNKAIQRSLTKAVARHGLGLYIYAGEDLPEEEAARNAESAEQWEKKLKDLRKQADEAIKAYSASFTADQKKELASQIKTITGGVANYMKVEDPDVLNKLIATFAKKEEANT